MTGSLNQVSHHLFPIPRPAPKWCVADFILWDMWIATEVTAMNFTEKSRSSISLKTVSVIVAFILKHESYVRYGLGVALKGEGWNKVSSSCLKMKQVTLQILVPSVMLAPEHVLCLCCSSHELCQEQQKIVSFSNLLLLNNWSFCCHHEDTFRNNTYMAESWAVGDLWSMLIKITNIKNIFWQLKINKCMRDLFPDFLWSEITDDSPSIEGERIHLD